MLLPFLLCRTGLTELGTTGKCAGNVPEEEPEWAVVSWGLGVGLRASHGSPCLFLPTLTGDT